MSREEMMMEISKSAEAINKNNEEIKMNHQKIDNALDDLDAELNKLMEDCGTTYDPNMTEEEMDKALDDLLEADESYRSIVTDEMDSILNSLLD